MNEFLWTVPHDHPALPGHFPGHPILPGVVLLDLVVDFIARHHCPQDGPWGITQVKFLRALVPGDTARFVIEEKNCGVFHFSILHETSQIPCAQGRITRTT